MDSKKSNKITDIVRLRQILKKWKKLANAPKNSNKNNSIANTSSTNSSSSHGSSSHGSSSHGGSSKGIKFIKRKLSISDVASNDVVPRGFLAVCVGKELKRYVIPTEYLSHRAFGLLLREAEEEFGFQQEGVLKIPCEVDVFEKILKVVEEKRDVYSSHELGFNHETEIIGCCSPDCELSSSHHFQTCRGQ